MTDLHKAAEMALEALINFGQGNSEPAKALRQALDYPTPEQIAFAQQIRPKGKSRIGQALAQQEPDEFCTATTEELMKELGCSDEKAKEIHDKVEALAQPEYQSTADKSKLEKVPAKGTLLAQTEQEPVAWFQVEKDADGSNRYIQVSETDPEFYVPLYAAPPKREWVGLTDDEIEDAWIEASDGAWPGWSKYLDCGHE